MYLGLRLPLPTGMVTQPKPLTIVAPAEPTDGNYFVAAYPPFSSWNKEAVGAAIARLQAAPEAESPQLGVYLHVPFCAHRCDYCYYLSFSGGSRGQMADYVQALVREAEILAAQPAIAGRRVDFVYFGGGTPSLLPDDLLDQALGNLNRAFPWSAAQEVSFECAPKTTNLRKLRRLRQAGVTRISMGVQQLDDAVLQQNRRVHLVADVERAFADVRTVGFDVVNLDLIVGLLGETDESFFRSLDRVIAWAPESITIYQLEVPRNTPLFRNLAQAPEAELLPSWETKRRRLGEAFRRIQSAGYTLRSAYAGLKDPVRHRFLYQDAQYDGADLLGLGVGSFSYLGGVHYQNTASMTTYVERLGGSLEAGVAARSLPIARGYALTDEERLVREFVLQLKLGRIDLEHFHGKFGVDVSTRFRQPLQRLSSEGWVEVDDRSIRLTFDGLLRADRLLQAFYLPQHRELSYW
jgi:oxygen-independent coproporphyrinogen-3 oxidase